jgi:hypothetical protein
MSIYYAIVEDDPLDNGGNSHVMDGSPYSTIEGPDGRLRRQTYLGHRAWCSVCNSAGEIVAGAGISDYLRGYDERLKAMEAVDGDIVLCKCERHPRIVSVYGRRYEYIDTERSVWTRAMQSSTSAISAFDEQVLPTTGRGSLLGYPYLIEQTDGQMLAGRIDSGGRLPRIHTDAAETYTIYWGDEALAHEEYR